MSDVTNLVERPAPDNGIPFAAMAERVRHNADARFGGAAVLVPPGGDEMVELLVLQISEPIVFWATLKSMVQQRLDALEQAQRQAGPYGGRR